MKMFKKICMSLSLVSLGLFATSCNSNADQIKIGVLQLATHGALDQTYEGFKDALESGGFVDGKQIKITFQNPEGQDSDMSTMAKSLVRDNELVLAIATPAAVAVQTAAKAQNSSAKILFTAVTDPVDAGLVASNEVPGGNITGTNDMNPVVQQIDLVKELIPSIKTLGILYTISEENSKVQAELAQARAEAVGLKVIVATVIDATDISSTTRKLINDGAEVIYIPTDNNLAKNIPSVTNISDELKVVTICGEGNMVTAGGTITLGINYYKLGKLTGEMAIEIIKNGKSPATMPVLSLSDSEYSISINDEAIEKIGIVVPDSIKSRISE